MNAKQETVLVEVTLAKDHTHAGRKCKAGDRIKVTEAQRHWLASLQVITTPAATKEIAK